MQQRFPQNSNWLVSEPRTIRTRVQKYCPSPQCKTIWVFGGFFGNCTIQMNHLKNRPEKRKWLYLWKKIQKDGIWDWPVLSKHIFAGCMNNEMGKDSLLKGWSGKSYTSRKIHIKPNGESVHFGCAVRAKWEGALKENWVQNRNCFRTHSMWCCIYLDAHLDFLQISHCHCGQVKVLYFVWPGQDVLDFYGCWVRLGCDALARVLLQRTHVHVISRLDTIPEREPKSEIHQMQKCFFNTGPRRDR